MHWRQAGTLTDHMTTTEAASNPTVYLETLGCSKNEVDSAKVTAMLGSAGYVTVDDAGTADVVMVNACAFIESARQESIETIIDLADTKRSDARLVVIGCMAQRYETELRSALPEADAVVGLDRYPELVGTLDRLVPGLAPADHPAGGIPEDGHLVDGGPGPPRQRRTAT